MPMPEIAEWFTHGTQPTLLGARCLTCSIAFFPPSLVAAGAFCRNPECDGTQFEPADLGSRGRIWSFTNSAYQPPPPYFPGEGDYRPFAIAAVEVGEGIVVLGQVAEGYDIADLYVGTEVELMVGTTSEQEPIWKWKPVAEVRS